MSANQNAHRSVQETAKKVAAERSPQVPSKEALAQQQRETEKRILEAQGVHVLETPEEEAALRKAAEEHAAHTTVYFSPDPPGWGEG